MRFCVGAVQHPKRSRSTDDRAAGKRVVPEQEASPGAVQRVHEYVVLPG